MKWLRGREELAQMNRFARTVRMLYMLSFLLSVAGLIASIASLASLQTYCSDNNGIVPGLKPQYQAAAALSSGIQGSGCDTRWRFQWFGLALQLTFLVTLFVIYKLRKVWRYKSALFMLAAIVTTLHMIYCNDLLIQSQRTQGNFKVRGSAAFVSFCAMSAGNILLAFFGSALYETTRSTQNRKIDPSDYSQHAVNDVEHGRNGTATTQTAGTPYAFPTTVPGSTYDHLGRGGQGVTVTNV